MPKFSTICILGSSRRFPISPIFNVLPLSLHVHNYRSYRHATPDETPYGLGKAHSPTIQGANEQYQQQQQQPSQALSASGPSSQPNIHILITTPIDVKSLTISTGIAHPIFRHSINRPSSKMGPKRKPSVQNCKIDKQTSKAGPVDVVSGIKHKRGDVGRESKGEERPGRLGGGEKGQK